MEDTVLHLYGVTVSQWVLSDLTMILQPPALISPIVNQWSAQLSPLQLYQGRGSAASHLSI